MIKESDIPLLNQLVKTLEDAFEKFEIAYQNKNAGDFNKLKVIIIKTQKRISQIIR